MNILLTSERGSSCLERLIKGVLLLVISAFLFLVLISNTNFIWEWAAPIYYRDLLIKNGRETGIDPMFVAAVVHVESKFQHGARSSVGAIGLMQILPETGKEIAKKTGVKHFQEEDLYVPKINLKIGFFYLKSLRDHYNGDMSLALAAYNGGMGSVDEWLKTQPKGKQAYNLATFPKKETVAYVSAVNKTYRFMRLAQRITRTLQFTGETP